MSKFWKRGAALVLAGVLCAAGLSGCSKKTEAKTVYTFNGAKVDAGLTNFLFRYQQAIMDRAYGDMFKQYYGSSIWNLDLSGTGEAYGTTYKNEFGETFEKLLLTEEHAGDYSIELTDDEKKAISDAADKFLADNEKDVLDSMSATKETVERALTLYTLQSKVEKAMSADVDTNVSDEEAAQRRVSYIEYMPNVETESEAESELSETEADVENTAAQTEGETSPVETEEAEKTGSEDDEDSADDAASNETEAASAAAETEAETELEDPAMAEAKALTKKLAQKKLDELLSDPDSLDFAAVSQNAKEQADGESYVKAYTSDYTFGKDDTFPDAAIIEATNDLADGTLVDHLVEANESWYILYVDKAFDEDATADKKEEIVEQRKSDKIDEVYDGWISKEEWTTDAEALAAIAFDREYRAPAQQETEAEESGTEAEIPAPETEAEVTAETEA